MKSILFFLSCILILNFCFSQIPSEKTVFIFEKAIADTISNKANAKLIRNLRADNSIYIQFLFGFENDSILLKADTDTLVNRLITSPKNGHPTSEGIFMEKKDGMKELILCMNGINHTIPFHPEYVFIYVSKKEDSIVISYSNRYKKLE